MHRMDGRTLKGKVQSTAGGVGRNVADCLARLKADPLLVSIVGGQEHAHTLLSKMDHMDITGIRIAKDARTATCVVILDHEGECLFVIGDMGIHEFLSPEQVELQKEIISNSPLVIMDGNIQHKTMDYIFNICSESKVPVFFEPTDITKASRPFVGSNKWQSAIAYASPNLNELRIMHNTILGKKESPLTDKSLTSILDESLRLALPLFESDLHTIVVTLGVHGALLITTLCPTSPFPVRGMIPKKAKVRAMRYPAPVPDSLISVSGAGDCFAAGMIAGILRGLDFDACIEAGQKAAVVSLCSHNAVPATMSPEAVFCSSSKTAKRRPSSVL